MKKSLLLLLIVALVFTVVGCKSTSSETSDDITKETPTETDEDTSETGDEVITVWIPGDDVEYSFYYNMFENYKVAMEAEGKTFEYVIEQQPWGDYWTKLPLEVNNGRGPDIYYVHTAYMDSLLPLSKELTLSDETMSQLNETNLFVGENGKPVFVPTVYTSMIMFANEKIVGEVTKAPTTWEELFIESSKYNDPAKGVIGFDYSFHALWDLTYANGNLLTDENGPIFDADALQTIVDWTNKGYVDYLGYGQGSPEESIYQDSAAYIYGAGWMEFWAPEGAELYAFPVPGVTTSNTELSYGISKNVSDNKYAVLNDFVQFMLTDEQTVTDIVKGNSGASNNNRITINYEPGSAGYAVQQSYDSGLTNLVVVPSGLETVYKTMLESALIGDSVEQVIEDAQLSSEGVDVSNLHKMEQALDIN